MACHRPSFMPRPSLHAALDDDNAEAAVARALEQRGNVNEKNEEGFSVLMVACSLGESFTSGHRKHEYNVKALVLN